MYLVSRFPHGTNLNGKVGGQFHFVIDYLIIPLFHCDSFMLQDSQSRMQLQPGF